jgi:hypothetical protein
MHIGTQAVSGCLIGVFAPNLVTMRTPPPVLPDEDTPTGYHPTLLDRLGPDAMFVMRARLAGVITLFVSFPIFIRALSNRGVGGTQGALFAGGLAVLAGLLAYWLPLRFIKAAGDAALALTFPSGKSTPYEEQFSYQDSLEARGDVAGALESYEAVIAERPTAVAPRLRAADLHARRGENPRRAAELFRELREMAGVSRRDALYASSRLVDLYDGPLNEPGRALVELRRIIEHHPGTRVAEGARQALPRLKARLAGEQGDG